jgi:CBS domain-containing protein
MSNNRYEAFTISTKQKISTAAQIMLEKVSRLAVIDEYIIKIT